MCCLVSVLISAPVAMHKIGKPDDNNAYQLGFI